MKSANGKGLKLTYNIKLMCCIYEDSDQVLFEITIYLFKECLFFLLSLV